MSRPSSRALGGGGGQAFELAERKPRVSSANGRRHLIVRSRHAEQEGDEPRARDGWPAATSAVSVRAGESKGSVIPRAMVIRDARRTSANAGHGGDAVMDDVCRGGAHATAILERVLQHRAEGPANILPRPIA